MQSLEGLLKQYQTQGYEIIITVAPGQFTIRVGKDVLYTAIEDWKRDIFSGVECAVEHWREKYENFTPDHAAL